MAINLPVVLIDGYNGGFINNYLVIMYDNGICGP